MTLEMMNILSRSFLIDFNRTCEIINSLDDRYDLCYDLLQEYFNALIVLLFSLKKVK